MDLSVYRILDANANRAAEGLRVVEEYARFVLDDRQLSEMCKRLRHDLAAVLAELPPAALLQARDTPGDVGTRIQANREYARSDARETAWASQKRVEQALRCLEEYSKLADPGLAGRFEQLRYRAYTLAKALRGATDAAALAAAQLYVLVDGRRDEHEFAALVSPLVDAGVHVLQLRDKQLDDRQLLQRSRLLRQLTRGSRTVFIMNDRPDLARLADADGVHVGQSELSVRDARAVVGADKLIGVSTHSLEQARQAVLDGADYLGCGPTFPSQTKRFDQFAGLELLRLVAGESRLPAFAIGGINLENLPSVLATGFTRVAVSAAITATTDPGGQARRFLELLTR